MRPQEGPWGGVQVHVHTLKVSLWAQSLGPSISADCTSILKGPKAPRGPPHRLASGCLLGLRPEKSRRLGRARPAGSRAVYTWWPGLCGWRAEQGPACSLAGRGGTLCSCVRGASRRAGSPSAPASDTRRAHPCAHSRQEHRSRSWAPSASLGFPQLPCEPSQVQNTGTARSQDSHVTRSPWRSASTGLGPEGRGQRPLGPPPVTELRHCESCAAGDGFPCWSHGHFPLLGRSGQVSLPTLWSRRKLEVKLCSKKVEF